MNSLQCAVLSGASVARSSAPASDAAKPKPISSQRSSQRRQREREIAERVFAEAIREIIAAHPDLGKEDLFPRLCGRFNLDDETWGQYQALGRRS